MLPNLDTLPAEIRESPRAVVWKFQRRDGKLTKVPYQAHRPNAKEIARKTRALLRE